MSNSKMYVLYVQITDIYFKEWYIHRNLSRNQDEDAGFDLLCIYHQSHDFKPFETKLVDTGVRARMVERQFMNSIHDVEEIPISFDVRARSSISKTNFILQNGIGTIDKGYSNNILLALRNVSLEDSKIPDERKSLAQIVHPGLKSFSVEFVDELPFSDTERGLCGFGSTGS